MKIQAIQDFHADLGWRNASYLKITTSTGIIGWSEYSEGPGNRGLTAVIRVLSEKLVGQNPSQLEWIIAQLNAWTIQCPGGINQQAIGAITNALLDVLGKSRGLPVSALLGGTLRPSIPVYWSHCGSYRVRHPQLVATPR